MPTRILGDSGRLATAIAVLKSSYCRLCVWKQQRYIHAVTQYIPTVTPLPRRCNDIAALR